MSLGSARRPASGGCCPAWCGDPLEPPKGEVLPRWVAGEPTAGIAASTATSHSTCRGAGECRPPAPGVLIPVDPAPTLVRLELRIVRRSGAGHCGHSESQRPEVEVSLDGQLRTRWRERAGLLKQIHHLIQKDGRVRAAWVEGSVARGNDDALSDIDIVVVVADNAVEDFIDNRRCHAAKPARPILLMDNLQNSLLRGAYLLAWYGGEAGPQHVDWFWQAESEARRPEEANVLFDRAGIRRVPGDLATMPGPPGPSLGPNPPLRELLTHKTTFVWAMSLIVAKHIARRNGETVARMTGVVARTLTDLVSLLRQQHGPPGGAGGRSGSSVRADPVPSAEETGSPRGCAGMPARVFGHRRTCRGGRASTSILRAC